MLKTLFVGALALFATVSFAQTTVTGQVIAQVPAPIAGPPVVTPPPAVTPPPVPPPPAARSFVVYANGVFHWGGDFNYGGAVANYRATDPQGGGLCLSMTAVPSQPVTSSNPTGGAGGGWLPWYKPGVAFDTTPYKYIFLSLKPTRAGQSWIMPTPEGLGDTNFPGHTVVTVEKFGPAPVIGQWGTYKIPLGEAGLNLPAGAKIAKFGVQDQMAWGAIPANAPNNVYYINNVSFSAN
jgi:hypothetical protein